MLEVVIIDNTCNRLCSTCVFHGQLDLKFVLPQYKKNRVVFFVHARLIYINHVMFIHIW